MISHQLSDAQNDLALSSIKNYTQGLVFNDVIKEDLPEGPDTLDAPS
jgi:hypothetical protein